MRGGEGTRLAHLGWTVGWGACVRAYVRAGRIYSCARSSESLSRVMLGHERWGREQAADRCGWRARVALATDLGSREGEQEGPQHVPCDSLHVQYRVWNGGR